MLQRMEEGEEEGGVTSAGKGGMMGVGWPGSKRGRVCLVCGDKALGYNFNAVSCESCKAFFRRNAHKTIRGRCEGKCEVTVESRSFCKRCRLAKCFTAGMRKDMILNEQEKVVRKRKILFNKLKRQGQLSPEDDALISPTVLPKDPVSLATTLTSKSPKDAEVRQEKTLTPNPSRSCKSPGSSGTSPPGWGESQELVREAVSQLPEKQQRLVAELQYAMEASSFLGVTSTSMRSLPTSPTEFINLAEGFVRKVIKVAKNITSFKTLQKDDQIWLLKGSVVDIMMLRSLVNYDPHTESWSLSTKDCLGKKPSETPPATPTASAPGAMTAASQSSAAKDMAGSGRWPVLSGSNCSPAMSGSGYSPDMSGSGSLPAVSGSSCFPAMNGSNSLAAMNGSNSLAAMNGSNSLAAMNGSNSLAAMNGSNSFPAMSGSNSLAAISGSSSFPAMSGSNSLAAMNGSNSLAAMNGSNSFPAMSGSNSLAAISGSSSFPAVSGFGYSPGISGSSPLPAMGGYGCSPGIPSSSCVPGVVSSKPAETGHLHNRELQTVTCASSPNVSSSRSPLSDDTSHPSFSLGQQAHPESTTSPRCLPRSPEHHPTGASPTSRPGVAPGTSPDLSSGTAPLASSSSSSSSGSTSQGVSSNPAVADSSDASRISAELLKRGSPEMVKLFLNYSRFVKALMGSIQGDLLVLEILIMMSLFSADRTTLLEREKVQGLQEEYASVLQLYTKIRFAEDKSLFARLVMKLTDLRDINEVHTKMLLTMKVNDFEPLLLEIFDL